jgi:hypothetical protein
MRLSGEKNKSETRKAPLKEQKVMQEENVSLSSPTRSLAVAALAVAVRTERIHRQIAISIHINQ